MDVKVRINCPECKGSGRKTIRDRVQTCGHCMGTGKREEWRPIVSGLKIVDSEEAR